MLRPPDDDDDKAAQSSLASSVVWPDKIVCHGEVGVVRVLPDRESNTSTYTDGLNDLPTYMFEFTNIALILSTYTTSVVNLEIFRYCGHSD